LASGLDIWNMIALVHSQMSQMFARTGANKHCNSAIFSRFTIPSNVCAEF